MAKRKQKPKSGKVIRVSVGLQEYLHRSRKDGETWDDTLRRLLGDKTSEKHSFAPSYMWTLPSKLIPTKAEAMGTALEEAVFMELPMEAVEKPIKVFER